MLHSLLYRTRWYPWLVVVLCMLIVATSNGLINTGITVFDEALLDEFGWSISEFKIRDSITFLGAALLVPLTGWLVDRYGFKPLLLAGMLLLSAAYYSYSYIENLSQLYALHLVFALTAACAGNMAAIVTAATWMQNRQGLAVGITIAGTSVGAIVLPPFANFLNQHLGWRTAMQVETLLPLLMFVVILLLVRNRRKDAFKAQVHDKSQQGTPFKEVLRSPTFYLIAIAGACTYYAILALFAHLFLFMRSLDYSPDLASLGLSTVATAALLGKIFAGWLSDRINPYRLFRAQMLLMLLGLVGISQWTGQLWLFLLITGLGWGSLHTLYNYLLINLFGLRDAGKINGSVSLAEAVGGGTGIYMTGLLHDVYGGYSPAFVAVVGVMATGVLLASFLRPSAPGRAAHTPAGSL